MASCSSRKHNFLLSLSHLPVSFMQKLVLFLYVFFRSCFLLQIQMYLSLKYDNSLIRTQYQYIITILFYCFFCCIYWGIYEKMRSILMDILQVWSMMLMTYFIFVHKECIERERESERSERRAHAEILSLSLSFTLSLLN